jgi:hypothetical protein
MKKPFRIFCCALILSLMSLAVAYAEHESQYPEPEPALAVKEHKVPEFFVPPPPFSEGIYPCSQCHAGMEPNPERRALAFHTEIAEIFDHAKDQRWCLDCHDEENGLLEREEGVPPLRSLPQPPLPAVQAADPAAAAREARGYPLQEIDRR